MRQSQQIAQSLSRGSKSLVEYAPSICEAMSSIPGTLTTTNKQNVRAGANPSYLDIVTLEAF